MTNFLSDKIKILSFVLIIIVLYIHSGFHADELEGMQLNTFIQDLISGKIGRMAVPLFFMISGYLFFLKTDKGIVSILTKINKRIRTLLLPYIYGCLFFVLFFVVLHFVPGASKYMNGDVFPIFNNSVLSIIKNVFWMSDGGNSPLAFQLWFLRDLILIVSITPLLYYLFLRFKWWSLVLFFPLTYLAVIPASILTSLFWFSVGSILAISKTNIDFKPTIWGIIVLIFYILLSVYEQIYGGDAFSHFQVLITLIGCIGVWISYDAIVPRSFSLEKHNIFRITCSFTFFIYLFHEPSLNVVRKIIVIIIGKSSAGYLISYLLSPFVFILCMVLVGSLIKKIVPKIYSNLVGGRI
ncbi:MAG: acyltransferase family protein [Paludibacter sp.]|nr:acyltransferase family protein [Paludibacter sp.]